jgi:hypothetical protein
VADAIKDCSRRNGLVLDPFAGSGTILIAAERTGRRARAMEIDPHYVDVAVERWQDYTGKSAVLVATGQTFEEASEGTFHGPLPLPATAEASLGGEPQTMEWVNPHTWLHIDVKNPDGTNVNWAIEAGTPNVLFPRGFTKESLLPGTEIMIDGYQSKDGSHRANGRDLTFPDGRKLFLGSSGTGAPYELTPGTAPRTQWQNNRECASPDARTQDRDSTGSACLFWLSLNSWRSRRGAPASTRESRFDRSRPGARVTLSAPQTTGQFLNPRRQRPSFPASDQADKLATSWLSIQ